jgi:hypothetical protein
MARMDRRSATNGVNTGSNPVRGSNAPMDKLAKSLGLGPRIDGPSSNLGRSTLKCGGIPTGRGVMLKPCKVRVRIPFAVQIL